MAEKDKGSQLVCQLPGCKSTQRDVESALLEYLGGYCVKCEKKRDGTVCGCGYPFPCSLTFKGQMLEKIHELIGEQVSSGVKAVQVCFKHPELLRLAREACIVYKESEDIKQDSSFYKGLRTVKITDECSIVNISNSLLSDNKLRVEIPEEFTMLPLPDHREFLQQMDSQGDILGSRDVTENMTGIVYTDEGGQEQSLLGKLVYTTDETGSSNIILQELGDETGSGKSGRIMKIQLADIPGFVIDPTHMHTGSESGLVETGDDSLEEDLHTNLDLRDGTKRVLNLPMDVDGGRKAGMRDMLEPATNSIILQHGIIRRKLGTPAKVTAAPRTITITRKTAAPKVWAGELRDSVLEGILEDKDNQKYNNNLKIQYKEFEQKMITSHLPSLICTQHLCDVLLICTDGEMFASSIVLAAISAFMRDLLDSIPRIDQYRTVILPDYFNLANLSLLNRIIFQDMMLEDLTIEELDNLLTIAQIFQCHQIAEFCETRILSLSSVMRLHLPASPAVDEPVEDMEDSLVLLDEDGAPTTGTGKLTVRRIQKKKYRSADAPLAVLKIDKNELNTDYLDSEGVVRLDSRDEMALHYCILCDNKFKKYKQAITHYKTVHLLEARLSCDSCDELFKDMFSCVKHKHEMHGGFERNLQCYICEEVFYSRFRLATHFKESHKDLHGDFVCKTCSMKFPASYYLDIHTTEDHTQLANSCNICGKTFSGKRYLTMHIKSSHTIGGKNDYQCKHCCISFSSHKEQAYHSVKIHKDDRPAGLFEECSFCDKFFKTKGELKQHTRRKHREHDD